MHRRLILSALLVIGCKKSEQHAPTPGSASGATPPADAAAAPAWTIESQPIELPCGNQPLALPPPTAKPPVDAALQPVKPLAVCQDQPSVAAACACLAGSVTSWTEGFVAKAECELDGHGDPTAQLVQIYGAPDDDATTSGGQAFVLVVRRGSAWSPLAIVDLADAVDLSVTPKASSRGTIVAFEARPLAGGTLYWIESRTETQEKSMGDLEYSGATQGTICVVGAKSTCFAPVELGSWEYAFTIASADQPDACKITSVATYGATVDASGVTLRLVHGAPDKPAAGHYKLDR